MITGIVNIDSTDVIPTACAEYSGVISYSSASIDTFVALGIAQDAVKKSISSFGRPMRFAIRQTNSGIATSFIAVT